MVNVKLKTKTDLAQNVHDLVPDVALETILQIILYKEYKEKLNKHQQRRLQTLESNYRRRR